MKKIISILIVAFAFSMTLAARDVVTRNINVLPAQAVATLNKYFSKVKVNHIKIDKKTFGGADYDVVLTNGTEIEFDSDGNWKEIDCGMNKVPQGFVLPAIVNHVKKYYKGESIVAIEKDRNKYEVELTDGSELEFDRAGNFRRADH